MDNKSVASSVPFHRFALLCEKLSTSTKEKKKEIFTKFLNHWRSTHQQLHASNKTNDSFVPVLRMLLPHLDRDRLSYGMKEVVLAKYYIEVLNISKESEDGRSLLNYKKPSSAKQNAGDFASVAYVVLKNRCPEKGSLSIEDVNTCLEAMSQANAAKKRDIIKKEIQRVIRNTSALEQKWLVRVMIKDMKMGVNENSIFPMFHPEAQELFNVCNSLTKVCTTLHDPSVRLDEAAITLMSPFRPMLGQRCAIDDVITLMSSREFFIETKIDGERMQMHKQGEEYKYFSRNAVDYTPSFGKTKHRGTLTPHIHSCFHIDSCILDGEMVVYDTHTQNFVLKGANVDVKSTCLKDGHQPCFVAFDVLQINKTNLVNMPFQERIEKFKSVFDCKEGRLQVVERSTARTKENVLDAINLAIDQREEGIVVKDPLSLYKPSRRKGSGWLKLKPEYVDSLSDDVDLLIVGGQYGTGRHRGVISHFILALADCRQEGRTPTTFKTFAKVGSGYTDKELNELSNKLNKHWVEFNPSKPPPNIHFSKGLKEKPDVWIEPCYSIVVQIKAAELIRSEKYAYGHTLRFPRLEKFRTDKNWNDCMTVEEADTFRQVSGGRLTHTSTTKEGPSNKKRRVEKIQRPISVPLQFQGANVSQITESCRTFSSREFCVINGPADFTKQQIEVKIAEFSGSFVQTPTPSTYCVVAEKLNVRVKNIISQKSVDVVKASWLIKCLNAKHLIPLKPSDMHFVSEKTRQLFRQDFDRYGDNFTEDINVQSLRNVFQSVPQQGNHKLTSECIADMEEKFESHHQGLFRRLRLYKVGTETDFGSLEFLFYGGKTVEQLENATHVLVNTSTPLEELRHQIHSLVLKPHIVTVDWIRDSIDANKPFSEGPYEPK